MASVRKKKTRSEYEKYDILEIRRDEIKNADYNPRSIKVRSKRKLKNNLERVGLLAPIIYNRRTGNIVAGHQRIDCLDQLHKTHDYVLRVAAVDLDEKTEMEQNVFMNNPEAQGEFTSDGLTALLKMPDIDIEATGFDQVQVYEMIGEDMTAEMHEGMADLSNRLHETIDKFREIEKKSKEKNDADFYFVVVFKNAEARADFCNRRGLKDNDYIDGKELDSIFPDAEI